MSRYLLIIALLCAHIGWTQSERSLTDREIDSLLSKLYRGQYFERQYRIQERIIAIQREEIFAYQAKDSLMIAQGKEEKRHHKGEVKHIKKRGRRGLVLGGALLFLFGFAVGATI